MNIGEALFTKVQRRLLALLFLHADRSYYGKELIRLAQSGSGAVQRELVRLEAAGLVTIVAVGNQRHYQANQNSPVFAELRALIVKSFGVADTLREALSPLLEQIASAWLFGSVAGGSEHSGSDIDLLVVAEGVGFPELIEVLSEAETKLGRPINPVLYSPGEFQRKRESANHFLKTLFSQPIIRLIGRDDNGTKGIGEPSAHRRSDRSR